MTIERVLLDPGSSTAHRVAAAIAHMHPGVAVEVRAPRADERVVVVESRAWRDVDFFEFGLGATRAASRGRLTLALFGDGPILARTAREVLIHLQRLLPERNPASTGEPFDEVLRRHRAALDPLVAADHDHALDVWQWVLRLDAEASLPVQIAALFPDVDRLASVLSGAVDEGPLARAAALVERRDRPDGDPEGILLADADALSFFSINACGFLRYYGERHTRTKLACALARLSPRGRRHLASVPLRADLRGLLREVELAR